MEMNDGEAGEMTLPSAAAGPLARYLATAWKRTVESLRTLPEQCESIAEIDDIYRQLIVCASDGAEQVAGGMLVRTHGSFLGAASMALSGQAAESYALMRNALRSALRGLFLASDLERQQIWLNRHDSDRADEQMRETFANGTMLRHLKDVDSATAGIYQRLHQRTIDRGYHSTVHGRRFVEEASHPDEADFENAYLVIGDEMQKLTLRTLAQVGICTLSIFYYVYSPHYRQCGFDVRLTELRHGH